MNSRLLHLFWLKWWLGLEAIITICWSPVVLQAQDSRGWYKCLQKNKFQGLINQQASTYFYYIYYLYTFSWFYNGRKEKHSFFVYKKKYIYSPSKDRRVFKMEFKDFLNVSMLISHSGGLLVFLFFLFMLHDMIGQFHFILQIADLNTVEVCVHVNLCEFIF